MPQGDDPNAPRTGQNIERTLGSLVLLARLHDIAADPERLRRTHFAADRPDTGLLRALRALGLRATLLESNWERLAQTPLPCLAENRDGEWLLVARADAHRVLVKEGPTAAPRVLPRIAFEAQWSGRLVLCTRRHDGDVTHRPFGFSWFVPAIRRYRALLGEVLAAAFCIQLLALATPLFFQVIVDKVLAHHALTTLDVLAVGLLTMALFEILLGCLRGYLLNHTCARIDVELGSRVFAHLQRLPLAYHAHRRVGDTVSRLRELDGIRQFLTSSTLTTLIDLAFIGLFLALMWYYSQALTLVVMATLPCYALLSWLVTPMLRESLAERFERGADNHAYLVEAISGIETLKGMSVGPQLQRRWEEQLAGHVTATFRAGHLGTLAGQVASLINKIGTVVIIWLGARLVIDGQLSVGQLIAFNMLALRVSGPTLRIVQLWQEFQQAGLSLRRLADLMNVPGERGLASNRMHPPRLHGALRFERVRFRYRPEGPDVLHDLDLQVEPGEVIGIVGRSGSGKSTLARLLLRLYTPSAGRIRLDELDLTVVDPDWLRRRIGVVSQDARLFNRTVRENIALADPALPTEKVIEAARLAGAHEFIGALPEGYETVIGEHGVCLSGGQRQRIAIARALVTNPDLLILDEATSALDYESERLVRNNLAEICHGRTVIIIAHRLSALCEADRILVLEEGRVIEQGVHAELLRSGGRYAELHACQAAT
jgi:subfamily B ATP-binding cassette protein HlyB/CyaB